MIRYSPTENANPQVGDVLLSEPFLNDPFFGRKAVLICENNEDGAMGLVLNNYIDVKIDNLMPDMPPLNSRVSIGGPVNNSNLYFLHTCTDIEGSKFIMDGIFMGGDFEKLKAMMLDGSINSSHIRFFIGYSGWGENQLANEIKSRSWFVTRVPPADLMSTYHDAESYWKKLINDMGDGYSHIANTPSNPSLN